MDDSLASALGRPRTNPSGKAIRTPARRSRSRGWRAFGSPSGAIGALTAASEDHGEIGRAEARVWS